MSSKEVNEKPEVEKRALAGFEEVNDLSVFKPQLTEKPLKQLPANSTDPEYTADASKCIFLHLVRNQEQIQQSSGVVFPPEFTHQIFGAEELISGYKGLRIDFYFSACRLSLFLKISYEDQRDDAMDLKSIFEEYLIEEKYLVKDRAAFDTILEEEQKNSTLNVPFGENLCAYERKGDSQNEYLITQSNHVLHEGLAAFKLRFQVFLKFFIETGLYVEVNEYWNYHFLYQKSQKDGSLTFIGLVSGYEFNIDAENQRYRISQMFILPPFQRKNHGQKLLGTVVSEIVKNKQCFEITVEDPSVNFQCIRDIVDCKNILLSKIYPWFDQIKPESLSTVDDLKKVRLLPENQQKVKNVLKLYKSQIQRTFQILLLSKLKKDSQAYKTFREIKIDMMKFYDNPIQMRKKQPQVIFEKQVVQVNILLILQQKIQNNPNDEYYEDKFNSVFDQYQSVIKKL